ncbi:hypothetical protein RAMDARK_1824 [Rickettsia amblyommatis str. Darkwater]|nr:hypothetical protein RAMDARK_1824 [Rickettsia amblyommatis str. Darkwater]
MSYAGEVDYHAGNLMVQDGKTITKIDHGRSFLAFHKEFWQYDSINS